MADIDVERTSVGDGGMEYADGRNGYPGERRRLSWGAIFAGFFVAIGVHMILALLGIAIGLSSWSPSSPGGPGVGDIATGVGIWAAISALIALFAGGATTGHLAGYIAPKDGFLHGTILWSLVTVAMIWLIMGGMGFLLGGAFGVIGQTASATVNVAGQAATEIAPAMISMGDSDRRQEVAGNIGDRIENVSQSVSDGVLTDDQRNAIAAAIADRAEITQDSARELITTAESRARERVSTGADSLRQRAQTAGAAMETDRQNLVNEIASLTGLNEDVVVAIVVTSGAGLDRAGERIASGVDTVKSRALGLAEDVTDTTAHGAWWTLLAFGLSLGAATTGATMTARK